MKILTPDEFTSNLETLLRTCRLSETYTTLYTRYQELREATQGLINWIEFYENDIMASPVGRREMWDRIKITNKALRGDE